MTFFFGGAGRGRGPGGSPPSGSGKRGAGNGAGYFGRLFSVFRNSRPEKTNSDTPRPAAANPATLSQLPIDTLQLGALNGLGLGATLPLNTGAIVGGNAGVAQVNQLISLNGLSLIPDPTGTLGPNLGGGTGIISQLTSGLDDLILSDQLRRQGLL
ncbi:MAG: hypothetical protein AB7P76_06640 [Candidatus Melainabacteria bacterium]